MASNELPLNPTLHSKSVKSETFQTQVYVENRSTNPSSMDVLRQFQANMATLEDLNGRMHFMMGEIRGIIRK